jgi:hypothetical protein
MMDVLDQRFRFCIQFDKNSTFTYEDGLRVRNWENKQGVSFRRDLPINWAGFNHLLAMVRLLETGLETSNAQVFHLISGQDFPIKSANEIVKFFEENSGKQFMENFAMPAAHWSEGGMNRVQYWYFYDLFNNKKRPGRFVNAAVQKIQRALRIKRKWSQFLPLLHGGGSWWSITRPCAEYIVKYGKNNPALLQRLKYTLCPEEIYFQTIVMNSPFANQVVSDHKRYIDWESRNGNSPANLDMTDLEKLISSDKLFARKFEYPVSQELCDAVVNKITA